MYGNHHHHLFIVIFEITALEYLLKQKKSLRRFDSLSPYSEFIGLNSPGSELYRAQNLSRFVHNPLMLNYFKTVPTAQRKLVEHLKTLNLSLSPDGEITAASGNGKK